MRALKLKRTLVLAAAALGAFSCAPNEAYVRAQAIKEPIYRIGPEDVLDVSVWRDPDLSKVVPVRPDGFISLPMVGEVRASGKTPTELEGIIKSRLAQYIQAPKVTVMVHEINSSHVYVTGEVSHPGVYPLRGRIGVLQALALAGGLSEFANGNNITVVRSTQAGGVKIPVSYGALVSDAKADFVLQPGDTVVVP